MQVRVQPVIEGPAAANLPDPSALTQSFTATLGKSRAIPVASFAPRMTAEQRPDLVSPDLVPHLTSPRDDYQPSTVTRVDTTTEPGRVLLRFSTSTANLGGTLHVAAGAVVSDGDTQVVQQRVCGAGRVLVHDAGEFVFLESDTTNNSVEFPVEYTAP